MSDLGMNLQTNDLDVVGGDLYIVKGTDAIAQDLQQTLQVWLGEWFLDTTIGIAYRQQILVKSPNLDLVHADLLNAALGVPGITQVNAVNFTYDAPSRSLSVTIDATDSTGQTITAQAEASMPTNTTIEGTPY
jgi:hypothetical protein